MSSSASSSSTPSDSAPPPRRSSSTSPTSDPAPPSRSSNTFSKDREAVITPVKGEKLSWKEIQARNVVSKFQDPCAHASDQARLCMNLYDHDKDACSAYFQAYRDCKDEWAKKRTH
ncbi:hypothetical protein BDY24DRAFT_393146 [Mrakia frigida]|uniref:Cox23p n=1 Tax=Mrakia frigida TaxID=29902 RepID=UPI003FCC11EB